MEQLLLTLISIGFVSGLQWIIRRGIRLKVNTRSWIFAVLAVILIPFGLAWSVTSFGENEPTAGYMGILVFSGLGVVCGILAHAGFFPGHAPSKPKSSTPTPIGKIVLVLVLALLIAFTLPWSMVTFSITKTLSNQERAQQLVIDQVVSDETLPTIVKRGLAYQTLYGDYPSHLKFRMIQSMLSGVENEEIIRLLDTVLPAKERYALVEGFSGSIAHWFNSDNPYPEYTLQPVKYMERFKGNTEFIVRWIYQNFSLPAMNMATIENVSAGNFSNNFDDYMQSPPGSLKERLIKPAAIALSKQLEAAEVPASVQIGDQLEASVDKAGIVSIKKTIGRTSTLLKYLWILPVVLLGAVAFILSRFVEKTGRLKWAGFSLLGTGVLGLLCSLPLQNSYELTGEIVLMIAGAAPPPALAVVEALVHPLLDQAAGPALTVLYSIVLLGMLLSILAYAKRIGSFLNELKGKKLIYSEAKKAVKA